MRSFIYSFLALVLASCSTVNEYGVDVGTKAEQRDRAERMAKAEQEIAANAVPQPVPKGCRVTYVWGVALSTAENGSGKQMTVVPDRLLKDDWISVAWYPGPEQFSFRMMNDTGRSISIDWDKSVFVDATGRSCKPLHSGVRLITRDQPSSPSVIAPASALEDFVLPANRVYFDREWRRVPILPSDSESAVLSIINAGEAVTYTDHLGIHVDPAFASPPENAIGSKLKVILHLMNGDVSRDYTFVFTVRTLRELDAATGELVAAHPSQ